MLDKIHIVLVGTTHPGNIGAAARAMKTMGLAHLVLVQPKHFPHAEATARASGADDILANARVFDDFKDSLRDYPLIIATSARLRSVTWPTLTPEVCAQKALQCAGQVALVFGREQTGLTNQELDHCHYLVHIPTHANFNSLNVASAVQILAYELSKQASTFDMPTRPLALTDQPAPAAAIEHFYVHLEQTLIAIEFLDPEKPRRLMRRLRRLFNRVQLSRSELNILRGILSALQKQRR